MITPVPTPPPGVVRPKMSSVAPSVCTRTIDGASFSTIWTVVRPPSRRMAGAGLPADVTLVETAGGVSPAAAVGAFDEDPEEQAELAATMATTTKITVNRVMCSL